LFLVTPPLPIAQEQSTSPLRRSKNGAFFTAVQELKKKDGGGGKERDSGGSTHHKCCYCDRFCGVRALGAFGASTLLHPWVGFASVGCARVWVH